jgi:trehalose 6-phosphate synthase
MAGASSDPLLVVSNRGPLQFGRNAAGERTSQRGGGGLVTALAALSRTHPLHWVASALTDEDAVVAEEGPLDEDSLRVRLVVHDREEYDRYYNVFANPALWFVQHYLWGLALAPDVDRNIRLAWDAGYVPCNQRLGEAAIAELQEMRGEHPHVLVQDYQLYLVPHIIREAVPDVVMEHFTHIPWPMPDYWRVLPSDIRTTIHESMLANDLVGLHRRRYVRNFLASVAEFTDAHVDQSTCTIRWHGRETHVRHYPISVDPAQFEELAASDEVATQEPGVLIARPERMVLRVDRTDPSKNIVRGFRAFEVFLSDHPEWHGRVTMLALCDPSRQDIPEYTEYVGAIQRAARRVNDRFYATNWQAVDLRMSDNFPQAVAAYKHYDVLLVNAIFDGMNLIAKEAPLVNTHDGALILSENTGAHAELGDWAITVNPFDIQAQADAIHAALTMPEEERHRRIEAIRAHVREHDIWAWIEAQLADLSRLADRPPAAV